MLPGNRATGNLNELDPTMERPRTNADSNFTQSINTTRSTTNGTSGNVNQAASTTPPGIEKFRIDNVPHHLQNKKVAKMKNSIFFNNNIS